MSGGRGAVRCAEPRRRRANGVGAQPGRAANRSAEPRRPKRSAESAATRDGGKSAPPIRGDGRNQKMPTFKQPPDARREAAAADPLIADAFEELEQEFAAARLELEKTRALGSIEKGIYVLARFGDRRRLARLADARDRWFALVRWCNKKFMERDREQWALHARANAADDLQAWYSRRADASLMNRGAAAAGTWIVL